MSCLIDEIDSTEATSWSAAAIRNGAFNGDNASVTRVSVTNFFSIADHSIAQRMRGSNPTIHWILLLANFPAAVCDLDSIDR